MESRFDHASRQYRKCIDRIPLHNAIFRKSVYRNLGHSLMKQGDYTGAIRAYEQSTLRDKFVVLNLLLCTLLLGDTGGVKKRFTEFVSVCDDRVLLKKVSRVMLNALGESRWIASVLGSTRTEIADWFYAKECMGGSFSLQSTDVGLKISSILKGSGPVDAAFIYLALGRGGEARDISVDRQYDENSRVNLGVSYMQSGQFELAMIQFQEAVRLNSTCWQARFNMGTLLRGKEGIECLEKVKNEMGLSAMADLYEEQGEFGKAAHALLMLLSTGSHKNDSQALTRLGIICNNHLKSPQTAHKYFVEAFDIDPSNILAAEWRDKTSILTA